MTTITKKSQPVDLRMFTIYGRPQGKQRPRLGAHGAFTPQATKDYEARMKAEYLTAHGDKPRFEDVDVAIVLVAVFHRKTHSDLDNIIKIVDGLNGVAWKDDRQVKIIYGELIVDKEQDERLELSIFPITERTDARAYLATRVHIISGRGSSISE